MTQSITTTPQNGTAIAAPPKANTLQAFLEQPAVKAKLAEVAASFMKPEDLIRLALMAASRQPEIAKCTPASVVRCLMDAAAVGVVPGGTNGRGYIVPRKNKGTNQLEACFDPGWRGLEDIAKRSGKVSRIDSQVVYAADEFQVEFGLHPNIRHTPNLDAADRGAIVAGYAIAYFTDGATQFEVLSRKDIDKIKSTSAAQNGPWKTWEEEMVRKSASRRLCKHLPVYDAVMERALEMATDVESGDRSVPPALIPGDTKALEDALMADPATPHTPDGEVIDETKGDA